MSVSEKVKCIDGRNKTLSISRQCQLLQLPRFSYYRPRASLAEGPDNLELMSLIDEEFLRYPFYGSRKMKVYLNRRGFTVNRKRVQRLMRLMGLECQLFPSQKPAGRERGIGCSLPAEKDVDHRTRSSVVLRYHLHSAGTRLCLSDSS